MTQNTHEMSDALEYLKTCASKKDESAIEESKPEKQEKKEEMIDDLTKLTVRLVCLVKQRRIVYLI